VLAQANAVTVFRKTLATISNNIVSFDRHYKPPFLAFIAFFCLSPFLLIRPFCFSPFAFFSRLFRFPFSNPGLKNLGFSLKAFLTG